MDCLASRFIKSYATDNVFFVSEGNPDEPSINGFSGKASNLCGECHDFISNYKDFILHIQTHTQKLHQCSTCILSFPSDMKHSDPEKNPVYNCFSCKTTFDGDPRCSSFEPLIFCNLEKLDSKGLDLARKVSDIVRFKLVFTIQERKRENNAVADSLVGTSHHVENFSKRKPSNFSSERPKVLSKGKPSIFRASYCPGSRILILKRKTSKISASYCAESWKIISKGKPTNFCASHHAESRKTISKGKPSNFCASHHHENNKVVNKGKPLVHSKTSSKSKKIACSNRVAKSVFLKESDCTRDHPKNTKQYAGNITIRPPKLNCNKIKARVSFPQNYQIIKSSGSKLVLKLKNSKKESKLMIVNKRDSFNQERRASRRFSLPNQHNINGYHVGDLNSEIQNDSSSATPIRLLMCGGNADSFACSTNQLNKTTEEIPGLMYQINTIGENYPIMLYTSINIPVSTSQEITSVSSSIPLSSASSTPALIPVTMSLSNTTHNLKSTGKSQETTSVNPSMLLSSASSTPALICPIMSPSNSSYNLKSTEMPPETTTVNPSMPLPSASSAPALIPSTMSPSNSSYNLKSTERPSETTTVNPSMPLSSASSAPALIPSTMCPSNSYIRSKALIKDVAINPNQTSASLNTSECLPIKHKIKPKKSDKKKVDNLTRVINSLRKLNLLGKDSRASRKQQSSVRQKSNSAGDSPKITQVFYTSKDSLVREVKMGKNGGDVQQDCKSCNGDKEHNENYLYLVTEMMRSKTSSDDAEQNRSDVCFVRKMMGSKSSGNDAEQNQNGFRVAMDSLPSSLNTLEVIPNKEVPAIPDDVCSTKNIDASVPTHIPSSMNSDVLRNNETSTRNILPSHQIKNSGKGFNTSTDSLAIMNETEMPEYGVLSVPHFEKKRCDAVVLNSNVGQDNSFAQNNLMPVNDVQNQNVKVTRFHGSIPSADGTIVQSTFDSISDKSYVLLTKAVKVCDFMFINYNKIKESLKPLVIPFKKFEILNSGGWLSIPKKKLMTTYSEKASNDTACSNRLSVPTNFVLVPDKNNITYDIYLQSSGAEDLRKHQDVAVKDLQYPNISHSVSFQSSQYLNRSAQMNIDNSHSELHSSKSPINENFKSFYPNHESSEVNDSFQNIVSTNLSQWDCSGNLKGKISVDNKLKCTSNDSLNISQHLVGLEHSKLANVCILQPDINNPKPLTNEKSKNVVSLNSKTDNKPSSGIEDENWKRFQKLYNLKKFSIHLDRLPSAVCQSLYSSKNERVDQVLNNSKKLSVVLTKLPHYVCSYATYKIYEQSGEQKSALHKKRKLESVDENIPAQDKDLLCVSLENSNSITNSHITRHNASTSINAKIVGKKSNFPLQATCSTVPMELTNESHSTDVHIVENPGLSFSSHCKKESSICNQAVEQTGTPTDNIASRLPDPIASSSADMQTSSINGNFQTLSSNGVTPTELIKLVTTDLNNMKNGGTKENNFVPPDHLNHQPLQTSVTPTELIELLVTDLNNMKNRITEENNFVPLDHLNQQPLQTSVVVSNAYAKQNFDTCNPKLTNQIDIPVSMCGVNHGNPSSNISQLHVPSTPDSYGLSCCHSSAPSTSNSKELNSSFVSMPSTFNSNDLNSLSLFVPSTSSANKLNSCPQPSGALAENILCCDDLNTFEFRNREQVPAIGVHSLSSDSSSLENLEALHQVIDESECDLSGHSVVDEFYSMSDYQNKLYSDCYEKSLEEINVFSLCKTEYQLKYLRNRIKYINETLAKVVQNMHSLTFLKPQILLNRLPDSIYEKHLKKKPIMLSSMLPTITEVHSLSNEKTYS
ncbi:unnamed protein product [Larinioides sclopetarius]|uniref:C2H2-type domain-containing protein n=1 Tax=Larinioides sclopetarius TaxID=280406 RepID=A0AAV2BSC9_9ARAC